MTDNEESFRNIEEIDPKVITRILTEIMRENPQAFWYPLLKLPPGFPKTRWPEGTEL
jgi:hypothetical protein